MLKVATCTVGRTVVSPNFFGLMGYFYFVKLWGYAARAAYFAINNECNQKGIKSPTGEKVSFFEFPNQPLLRKRWIHAIRRDERKNWQITRETKVCSLHFRREDLRKSLAGRTYLVDECVPSRFA